MKMVLVVRNRQRGFTLIEIAIVLVIVGLLIGGALKGQEMLQNAKLKSLIQDLDGVTAAHYAYQERMGGMAGDVTNVNGMIDDEAAFWIAQREQGFLKGDPASGASPLHSLGGVLEVGSGTVAAGRNWVCASLIDSGQAEGLDRRYDDGKGNSGFLVWAGGGDNPAAMADYPDNDVVGFFCKLF
ncbi:type II secretion system protein [Thiomicrorhabdus sp.]|uniref:type II secretion system protein n=1 Tax=Thiomicrorhabdus sp. TaxID=2039724 RepID=UPI0029C83CD1|nr:prepilin-type N-terminal cleavage/methylation domain-containing protein [Thiomicrorhabdus sp.]